MAVRVVTDSASDLPLDLATRHRIHIVPLTVRVGDEEFGGPRLMGVGFHAAVS